MTEALRDKAISGAKWRVVTAYLSQVIQVVSAWWLARLLVKEDYGVVAAAMVVVSVIRACGSLGMNYALVQRRGRVQDATSTAFVLLLGVAGASYGALWLIGPHTSAGRHSPRLLMVLGLLFFLRPVAIVTDGTLQREFRFRKMFLVEFWSVLASAALAVALASLLPAPHRFWALAVSGLVREGIRSAVSWRYAEIRPRLRFDWAVARELLAYGRYFAAGAVVMVLYGNLERFALGELLSVSALGLYVFAYRWVFRAGDMSEVIFGGVALPIYAKLQDDVPRLRRSFCRIVTYSALLSTALLTGLVLLSHEGVSLAFPVRWRLTIPIFRMLGFYYIVRAVDTTTGQLYASVGKPKYNMYLGLVNLGVMAVAVVPLVLWQGALGAAACVLAARTVTLACNVAVCRRVLQCSARTLGRIVMPALVASAVMALAVSAATLEAYRRWGTIGWLPLGGLVAVGVLSYGLALLVFEHALFREVLGIVRHGLKGMKARLREQAA